MDLVLLALILGSIFYAAKIGAEYIGYAAEIQPLIADLEQRTAELVRAAESETMRHTEIRGRIPALQGSLDELRRKLAAFRGEMEAEQKRKQKLEMEGHKQRIRQVRNISA